MKYRIIVPVLVIAAAVVSWVVFEFDKEDSNVQSTAPQHYQQPSQQSPSMNFDFKK